ncbi:MAG TPA: succinate dehydrogenase, cytochrome b556 subunit [Burkholderiales bacterium]|nr:succinate dehydrogenase, cytochrome b556 subunit [Burkholderiales bacterium]
MPKSRPKYLDLFRIRLPLPGLISILHRITGAGLFLLIPLVLYLLQSSLQTPQAFASFKDMLGHPLIKLLLIGIAWAYLHHLCAGIRHLALDLHYGTELAAARASSWAVLAVSVASTLVFGALIW